MESVSSDLVRVVMFGTALVCKLESELQKLKLEDDLLPFFHQFKVNKLGNVWNIDTEEFTSDWKGNFLFLLFY